MKTFITVASAFSDVNVIDIIHFILSLLYIAIGVTQAYSMYVFTQIDFLFPILLAPADLYE